MADLHQAPPHIRKGVVVEFTPKAGTVNNNAPSKRHYPAPTLPHVFGATILFSATFSSTATNATVELQVE